MQNKQESFYLQFVVRVCSKFYDKSLSSIQRLCIDNLFFCSVTIPLTNKIPHECLKLTLIACKQIFIRNIHNFCNKFKLDYDGRETLLAELSLQNINLDGSKNNLTREMALLNMSSLIITNQRFLKGEILLILDLSCQYYQ